MSLGSWITDKFLRVERDKVGNWSYWFGGNAFGSPKQFLEWAQTNPPLMTTIALRCKLYAQMKISAINIKTGEDIGETPETLLLDNPNYFQSKHDFLFQQMWYMSAVGTCYTYEKRALLSEVPKAIYNLIPSKTDFKDVFKLTNFISTQQDINTFERKTVKYELAGQDHYLLLRDIIPFYDLASGLNENGWCESPSRIKGITKVLENIEENLRSKNMNLKMTQKYIASNKAGADGQPQIQPADRSDIETKLGVKNLHVTNANVEVFHLVKDLKNLYLDPMYQQDVLTILLAFDMNRDVLNYSSAGASTHDNQNQGIINVIQNSIQASTDNSMNSFTNSWKTKEKGYKLAASFDHLPVMQGLVTSKVATLNTLVTSLSAAIETQIISLEDAKAQYNKTKISLGL